MPKNSKKNKKIRKGIGRGATSEELNMLEIGESKFRPQTKHNVTFYSVPKNHLSTYVKNIDLPRPTGFDKNELLENSLRVAEKNAKNVESIKPLERIPSADFFDNTPPYELERRQREKSAENRVSHLRLRSSSSAKGKKYRKTIQKKRKIGKKRKTFRK